MSLARGSWCPGAMAEQGWEWAVMARMTWTGVVSFGLVTVLI